MIHNFESDRLIASVVHAARGRIVGRVRLQKIFYLLDRLGLQSKFDYEYHYYGPYSSDLADAIQEAKAFCLIKENVEYRASDGMPYSIYIEVSQPADDQVGGLPRSKAVQALTRMQVEEATVLELAATIDWLRTEEQVSDWKQELLRRKAGKATAGRVERAQKLLCELGL